MGFLGADMSVGYDGTTAWEDSGQGAEKRDGLDLAIILRDADFATPFFDHEKRGYEIDLIGESDFEGLSAIALSVKRGDGSEEVWYLDPDTYLEMARTSPGSDWLGEVPRTTYYDDFREVEGVMIPFYTESQWYTRDRIFEVKNVEINLALDDDMFELPLPPGMKPLISLIGEWDVALETRSQPGAEWESSERKSRIESQLGGGVLQEQYESDGIAVLRTFTYDRFAEQYRFTTIDARRTHMNVQEGKFGEDGRLTASNVDSGTTWSGFGMTFHGRFSLFDITEDGFLAETESSIDGGENWFVNGKATYTRTTGDE
jgi:hypothetical protein